jgi:hypothetical protein
MDAPPGVLNETQKLCGSLELQDIRESRVVPVKIWWQECVPLSFASLDPCPFNVSDGSFRSYHPTKKPILVTKYLLVLVGLNGKKRQVFAKLQFQ